MERFQTVELLFAELVERDLQGTFEGLRGGEVGDVASVTHADLLVGLAVGRQVALRPGELRAEEVSLTVAFVPGGLGSRRSAGEIESAGSRLHRLILLGGDFEVESPHPVSEDVLGGPLLAVRGLGLFPEINNSAAQQENPANSRSRSGAQSSRHRNTSLPLAHLNAEPPSPF